MKNWIFLKNGKGQGPVTTEQMLARIRQSQLGVYDLVCREGESSWRFTGDYVEFKGGFQSLEGDREWVVLRVGAGKNLQRGPFSTSEIQLFLLRGALRYRDFVWRSGMTQWIPISEVKAFHSPGVSGASPQSLGKKQETGSQVLTDSDFSEESELTFKP